MKNSVLKNQIETAKNNPLLRFSQLKEEFKIAKIPVKQELLFSIITIERFAGEVNVPFKTLYVDFKKNLNAKRGKAVAGKNDKGRLRRSFYRLVEQIEGKKSQQSKDFNIANFVRGIKIKTKFPIEYRVNSKGIQTDAVTDSVDNNFFTFQISSLRPLTEKEKASLLKRKLESIAKAFDKATKETPKATPKRRKAKAKA